MKRFPTLFILYTLFLLLCSAPSQAQDLELGNTVPKREIRATWIATIGGIDWPSSYAQNTPRSIEKQQNELRQILDQLQRAGINLVLLQTRVRGTTIYPSKYEPWDGCLSGKPGVGPGYDALQFAIDECHKRGMELHAWVVTIPVGKWDAIGCKQLRKRYPKLIKKIGAEGYLNPENAMTGRVIADLCDEIVEKYDVDGIHLDYIRYPEDWKITVSRSKGRENITRIAKAVADRVKARKPWVKMSCAPIGKADDLPRQSSRGWNAYSRVCQDAQGWLRDGIMDMLFPMMYFKGDNFYPFLFDWKERSFGKPVVPGLGLYFMSEKERNWDLGVITQEMEVARSLGMGHCMYRSRFFTDNTKGIYDFTANHFNRSLALIPAIDGPGAAPEAPASLQTDSLNSTINWSGVGQATGEKSQADNVGGGITYNIYASREWPVDVADARNLVRVRLDSTACLVPLTGAFYAVTAMDRYGRESVALQMARPERYFPSAENKEAPLPANMIPCDGKTVRVTEYLSRHDLILLQSLHGKTVKTMLFSEIIDVSSLPEGIYQIRLLGKNNATHRIGYFMIKPRQKT